MPSLVKFASLSLLMASSFAFALTVHPARLYAEAGPVPIACESLATRPCVDAGESSTCSLDGDGSVGKCYAQSCVVEAGSTDSPYTQRLVCLRASEAPVEDTVVRSGCSTGPSGPDAGGAAVAVFSMVSLGVALRRRRAKK